MRFEAELGRVCSSWEVETRAKLGKLSDGLSRHPHGFQQRPLQPRQPDDGSSKHTHGSSQPSTHNYGSSQPSTKSGSPGQHHEGVAVSTPGSLLHGDGSSKRTHASSQTSVHTHSSPQP